jgi:hypothetical protein
MAFGGSFGRPWGPRKPGDPLIKPIQKTQKAIIRNTKSSVPAKVIRHTRAGERVENDPAPTIRYTPTQEFRKAYPPPVLIPAQYNVALGTVKFKVIILSAEAANLKACLQGLFICEPDLMDRVIVVDDGAKKDLEDLPGVIWVAGKKPFVFSRNVNLGIRAADGDDVILLNDDGILKTPGGFTLLAQACRERPNMGVCSAGILGHVGNHNQNTQGVDGVRQELKKLAFVCVYIPRAVIDEIGYLDERFVGYGYEDDDFCTRAFRGGFSLGIFDRCMVEHASIPSTFRAKPDYAQLITDNRLRYEKKWYGDKGGPRR